MVETDWWLTTYGTLGRSVCGAAKEQGDRGCGSGWRESADATLSISDRIPNGWFVVRSVGWEEFKPWRANGRDARRPIEGAMGAEGERRRNKRQWKPRRKKSTATCVDASQPSGANRFAGRLMLFFFFSKMFKYMRAICVKFAQIIRNFYFSIKI